MGSREENREAMRQCILGAAWVLFAGRGFDDVSMADIAAAAGVSRATVFNHFSTKHSIVEALTEGVLDFYRGMLDLALADGRTPTTALMRALFEQMGAGIESDRRFFRAIFREIASLHLGYDEGGPGQRADADNQARLIELVRRGQERGELSTAHSPEAIASAFGSLANGTITHWLYDDPGGSLVPRMRAAVEVLLGPIETSPSRPRRSLPNITPERPPLPDGLLVEEVLQ